MMSWLDNVFLYITFIFNKDIWVCKSHVFSQGSSPILFFHMTFSRAREGEGEAAVGLPKRTRRVVYVPPARRARSLGWSRASESLLGELANLCASSLSFLWRRLIDWTLEVKQRKGTVKVPTHYTMPSCSIFSASSIRKTSTAHTPVFVLIDCAAGGKYGAAS